jgi:hypothetical protein
MSKHTPAPRRITKDANLIEAAPALLAALRGVDEQCQMGLNSSDPKHWEAALLDIMGSVRDAIKLAGEE